MQNDYFGFILSAYGISALALLGLSAWVFLDARARLQHLDLGAAGGLRRRSARGPGA